MHHWREWQYQILAKYMGPTARIDHILLKLSVIFGTVASFDILIQNFYKVTQGYNKKAPPLQWGWKGPLIKSSFIALEAWWT